MKKNLRKALVALFAAALLSGATTAQAQTLYGYARNFSTTGFLKIDVANTAAAQFTASAIQPTGGAIKDNTMYITGFDDDYNTLFYSVDLESGKATKIATVPESVGLPMDMSYNYNDEKMYYVCNSDNEDVATSKLCTIDLTNGKAATVKRDLGFFVRAMAISTDGVMYYVTRDGDLYTYVISTGKNTKVGSTGIKPRGTFSSMGFDRNANKLYWAVEKSDSYVNKLYEINTTTGEATEKGVIGSANNGEGYWTVALDAAFTAAEEAAPAKVDDLAAEADAEGGLSVNLSWTNPSKEVNDADLTAITKVEISRNDEVIATLTDAKPGEAATYTDAPAEAGLYRYHVVAYNETGASADRFVDVYVGHDVPGPVLLPLADLFGANKVANVLTWHAPEAGKNGGYVDQESLKYDIVRLNDNKVLAENQAFEADGKGMMTFEDDDLQTLQRYEYLIVARNADGVGDSTETNFIVNGPAVKLEPTWSSDFNSKDEAMLWTPFDANGDGYAFEWHWYSALGQNLYVYQAHPSNYAADFLVSPPMVFTEGHEYTITVKAANGFAPYPEEFTISTMGGNAPHGAQVGQPLTDPVVVSHADELKEYTFHLSKLPDDGLGTDHDTFPSFLAIYCESNPAMNMFLTTSFTITDDTAVETGISTVASSTSANAPVYNLAGQRVSSNYRGVVIQNGKKYLKK